MGSIECPGDNCGHPIKESDLEGNWEFSCPNCGLLYERCFGCGTFNYFDEDDEDDTCSNQECGLSFTKCPTEGCKNQIESSLIEENNGFDCDVCGEGYNSVGDDGDSEKEEPEIVDVELEPEIEPEEEEEEEVLPEPEPEPEPIVEKPPKRKRQTKKKSTKKKKKVKQKKGPRTKKGVIRHYLVMDDYLDFFFDHPEGVTVHMIEQKFKTDIQASHYARRRCFAFAKAKGHEVEESRMEGTNEKLFFIREV